jgi:hypothetical protein
MRGRGWIKSEDGAPREKSSREAAGEDEGTGRPEPGARSLDAGRRGGEESPARVALRL